MSEVPVTVNISKAPPSLSVFFFPWHFLGQPVTILGKVPVTAKKCPWQFSSKKVPVTCPWHFWLKAARDIWKVPVTIFEKVAVTFARDIFWHFFIITLNIILSTPPPFRRISTLCASVCVGEGGGERNAIQVYRAKLPAYDAWGCYALPPPPTEISKISSFSSIFKTKKNSKCRTRTHLLTIPHAWRGLFSKKNTNSPYSKKINYHKPSLIRETKCCIFKIWKFFVVEKCKKS